MAAHLVIERPQHAPRLLGTFKTRADAEVARGELIERNPAWESFLWVIGRPSPGKAPIETQRST